MNDTQRMLRDIVGQSLIGKGAHIGPVKALEGLDWKQAGSRPDGLPHSIFQLVNHMTYWQQWLVEWLDGEDPSVPDHAEQSWPGDVSPATEAEWEAAVDEFITSLEALKDRSQSVDLLSEVAGKSRLGMFQTMASHNSHHLGQVVAVRQVLGVWPPPSGGLTW